MEEANQLLRDAALAHKVVLEVEFDVAGAGKSDLHARVEGERVIALESLQEKRDLI